MPLILSSVFCLHRPSLQMISLHFVAVTITQGQLIRQQMKILSECSVFFFFRLPLAALNANCQMKYSHIAAKHTSMAFCCKRNFQEWPLRDDIIAIMIHSCDLTAPVAVQCWAGIANQLSLCLQYLICLGPWFFPRIFWIPQAAVWLSWRDDAREIPLHQLTAWVTMRFQIRFWDNPAFHPSAHGLPHWGFWPCTQASQWEQFYLWCFIY